MSRRWKRGWVRRSGSRWSGRKGVVDIEELVGVCFQACVTDNQTLCTC